MSEEYLSQNLKNTAAFEYSLKTTFVDGSLPSNGRLCSALISNDPEKGTKVLSTIEDELSQAKEFAISVAFITKSGITPLLQALETLEAKGVRGRILTTDYLHFTEPGALRTLMMRSNIEIRMFRVFKNEGFHTKGYIFHSSNDLLHIIIGSSNLTSSALTTNREWNTRIVSRETGEIAKTILKEFESLWANENSKDVRTEIETYAAEYAQVSREQREARKYLLHNVTFDNKKNIEPNSMQTAFLDRLRKLRENGANKALLISATGTGKTFAAAFAVKEMMEEYRAKKEKDKRVRMLFVVHREQIARQALKSFKRILGKEAGSFGLLSGTAKAVDSDFLFSTVQTMSKVETMTSFASDAFDIILIDEVHRAGAKSYQKIMEHFKPKFWLGMTGSPERTDGYDIFKLFDYNIAHEIRLQDALKEDLLTPFHYFGIADHGGNDGIHTIADQFTQLYTKDQLVHVLQKADYYGHSGDRVKGLVFAASKSEARYIAQEFTQNGHPALALSGEDSQDRREEAIYRLTHGRGENRLDYLVTVDIFNEGVDIPEVNQVILLRPTESAIVFVQQLGRGLRKAADKEYVVVLDFIGNYSTNFFIPTALSGDNSYVKERMRRFISTGSKRIPGASTVHFDPIAKERIYAAIDSAKTNSIVLLRDAYILLRHKLGRVPELTEFETHGSIDALKILLRKDFSYYELLRRYDKNYEGCLSEKAAKRLIWFSNKLGNALRPSEALVLKGLLGGKEDLLKELTKELSLPPYNFDITGRHAKSVQLMLDNKFERTDDDKKRNKGCEVIDVITSVSNSEEKEWKAKAELWDLLQKEPAFKWHVEQITKFVLDRWKSQYAHRWKDTFLVLGKMYTYEDVCRLLEWPINLNGAAIGGYRYDAETRTLPIFVNYRKDADAIAYDDRFLSPSEFISLSKKGAAVNSVYADRMMKRKGYEDIRILLFVRRNKKDEEAKAFYFLGEINAFREPEAIKLSSGESAFEMYWKLEDPVPDELYSYLTEK